MILVFDTVITDLGEYIEALENTPVHVEIGSENESRQIMNFFQYQTLIGWLRELKDRRERERPEMKGTEHD